MKSINEQLNLPLRSDGQTTYQPSQYNGTGIDYERSYATPIVTGGVYKNATGKSDWSGCNSCGGFSSANGWNNATGTFEFCGGKCMTLHPFNKTKRDACIAECKTKYSVNTVADYMTQGLKPHDVNDIKNSLPTALGGNKQVTTSGSKTTEGGSGNGSTDGSVSGMSNGAKIGIAVGALAVVGLVIFLVKRKK